jgi:hypothetical protein
VTDETRARFLAAIAAQIPIERIAEVHLFPAIRQGGMESGVAVIAVEHAVEEATEVPTDAPIDAPPPSDAADEADAADEPYAPDEPEIVDGVESDAADEADDEVVEPAPRRAPRRYTVFSARYRHTLKGPDRGKWEVGVTEEADAPLRTVDAVVRGVQRRSGDADEIVRLSGDEVRALLPVPAAT